MKIKKLKKTLKIGRHKSGGRIMLEAQWLADYGFPVGGLYVKEVREKGWPDQTQDVIQLTAVNKPGPNVRKVSGGWTSDRRKACPVIDLKGVRDVFGEAPTHVDLEIVGGAIVIAANPCLQDEKEATR